MMKCKKCFRKITAKISVVRGFGPTCWEKVQAELKPQKKVAINFELIKNLISSIANSVSSKTLELLTLLKVTTNPMKILNKITESNEIIDRIIRPIMQIVEPKKKPNVIYIG